MANKTVTHHTGLSFVTDEVGPRGRLIGTNFFDVPHEDYGNGWITGMKAAREMLDWMRGQKEFCLIFPEIMNAAYAAAKEFEESSRRGAAVGFMRTLEQMLIVSAQHIDYAKGIDRQIERQERIDAQLERRETERRLDFVARMKEAKAKKAAERLRAA